MADSVVKKRAAARREALLSARGNRLAKLTSSARGEEAASLYGEDSPQTSVRASPAAPDILGEEISELPRPTSTSGSPHSVRTSTRGPSPSVQTGISPQQEEMMRAIFSQLGAAGPLGAGTLPSIAPGLTPPGIKTPTAADPMGLPPNPFAAMLAQMANQQPGGDAGSFNPLAGFPPGGPIPGFPTQNVSVQPPAPKPLLLKIAPLLHAISVIALLAYFVIRVEPDLHKGVVEGEGIWDRWSSLARYEGGVQAAPLFYAFASLQVVLHSIRVYYEPPAQPPSGLLGMALSQLPSPYPTMFVTALKYVRMGSAVLDDLCVLLFAIGIVVWAAGLASVTR